MAKPRPRLRFASSGHSVLLSDTVASAKVALPTAFIEICEESARSCHGLWSLSNVYELYRRAVIFKPNWCLRDSFIDFNGLNNR
jgi:hypothetical protein